MNDTISPALEKYPERFVELVTIVPQNPKEATEELKRAMIELRFEGSIINSHIIECT
jgi:predicted TIM-barrel fold metal-dependent hydrolase